MQRRDIRTLFKQFAPMVVRRAFALLGNRADAEEAAQEVFIRVLKRPECFEDRAQVSSWLYRITTNYCLNLMRDRKRRRELLDQEDIGWTQCLRPGLEPTQMLALQKVLSEADPEQAQAAVYVYVDGMRQHEAAKLLGVSRRTVGNLLDRFRAWAQELMKAQAAETLA